MTDRNCKNDKYDDRNENENKRRTLNIQDVGGDENDEVRDGDGGDNKEENTVEEEEEQEEESEEDKEEKLMKERNKRREKRIEKENEFNIKQLQREEERRLYYQGWTEYRGGCVVDFGSGSTRFQIKNIQNGDGEKFGQLIVAKRCKSDENENENENESEDENDQIIPSDVLLSEREIEWKRLLQMENDRKGRRFNDMEVMEEE